MEQQEYKRYYLINENISEQALSAIIEGIHAVNELDDEAESAYNGYEREPIKIVVETFGGDCYTGMALVNTILTSKTPIHTYSYGKTMSMGVPIFAAGHVRHASRTTSFMYHQMSGGMHGTLEGIKDSVEEWSRLEDVIDSILYEHTLIPKEMIENHKLLKRDWFFSGEEAYEYGLVDVILDQVSRKFHTNEVSEEAEEAVEVAPEVVTAAEIEQFNQDNIN